MEYKISELLMNNEKPYYQESDELKEFRKVRKVEQGNTTRYLTCVDDKNMTSITIKYTINNQKYKATANYSNNKFSEITYE